MRFVVNNKATQKTRQGNIALALLISTSLLLAGNMMVLTVVSQQRGVEISRLFSSALTIAQDGAQRAIWEMNYNGWAFSAADGWRDYLTTGSCGTIKTACQLSDQYSYIIPGPGGTTLGRATIIVQNINGDPQLTSTGTPEGVNVSTRVVVQLSRNNGGRLNYAIFGVNSVNPHTFAVIDSYDSTLGAYNPVTANSNGNIATNAITASSIHLQVTGTTVKGNASIGPGGDPITGVVLDSGTALTGTKNNLSVATTVNPVGMPATCSELGAVELIAGATMILSPGTYCADSVKMDGVTSRLYTTGQVKLYVRNWLAIQYGSKIESDGGAGVRPENMQIYLKQGGTGVPSGTPNTYAACANRRACVMQSVSPNNAKITATLYAPDVDVFIGSYTDWYGAVLGKSAIIGSGKIHYDEHLLQVDLSGLPGNTVHVSTWRQEQP